MAWISRATANAPTTKSDFPGGVRAARLSLAWSLKDHANVDRGVRLVPLLARHRGFPLAKLHGPHSTINVFTRGTLSLATRAVPLARFSGSGPFLSHLSP